MTARYNMPWMRDRREDLEIPLTEETGFCKRGELGEGGSEVLELAGAPPPTNTARVSTIPSVRLIVPDDLAE